MRDDLQFRPAGEECADESAPATGGAEATATPLKVLPNVSLTGGVTYCVWKYMHFFANARYVHAQYAAAPTGVLSLDELVVSAGLGWQLRLRKKG